MLSLGFRVLFMLYLVILRPSDVVLRIHRPFYTLSVGLGSSDVVSKV